MCIISASGNVTSIFFLPKEIIFIFLLLFNKTIYFYLLFLLQSQTQKNNFRNFPFIRNRSAKFYLNKTQNIHTQGLYSQKWNNRIENFKMFLYSRAISFLYCAQWNSRQVQTKVDILTSEDKAHPNL